MSAPARFAERWSRLKKAAAKVSADTPAGELPDAESLLAELGPNSDFGVFMREEVSEAVRRKAMKTLFADPHFNVMDGLDTYIDDYSISEPIPPEMMAMLNQAKILFDTPEQENGADKAGSETQNTSGQPDQEMLARCDILADDGQNVALPIPQDNAVTQNQ